MFFVSRRTRREARGNYSLYIVVIQNFLTNFKVALTEIRMDNPAYVHNRS